MVGVEVEAEGQRVMLPAAKGQTLFLDARDAALLRHLQEVSREKVPGTLMMPKQYFLQLLGSLPAHPRVTIGKRDAVQISYTPARPELKLAGETARAAWSDSTVSLVGDDRAWAFTGDSFHPLAPSLPTGMLSIFDGGHKLDAAWLASNRESLANWFELDDSVLANLPEVIEPEISLVLEGSLNHQEAQLFFGYGAQNHLADEREPVFVDGYITDLAAERAAIHELERHGFNRKAAGKWVLKDKSAILSFLAHGYPQLPEHWNISTGERFAHASSQVEPVEANFDFQGSGENWFNVAVEFYTPSGEGVPRQQIQHLLQMGQNSQKTPSGKIAVVNTAMLESLEETVADIDAQQETVGIYTVDRSQAGYLEATAADNGITFTGDAPWLAEPSERGEIPPHLEDILRPYQREGADWMLDLAASGMGGVLADDMGLGKTLQTLTLIQSSGGPALVVCPSSLVFNWVAEAQKFTPDLKCIAIEGPKREATYQA
ncbi:MAG: SNF2-related protein, partial [Verrucomicrobiota bacterium]